MRGNQIPATIDEAKEVLGGLGKLLNAKGWERAAIVYAFTEEVGKDWRRGGTMRKTKCYTVPEFADLGIYGMRDEGAVYAHRRNWQWAIDQGFAVAVEPGDDVVLPDVKYPPTGNDRGVADAFKPDATVERRIEGARKLIEESPEVARRIEQDFVQKAGQDPALAARVQMASEEFHPEPLPRERPKGGLDLAALLGVGADVYVAVKAMESRIGRLAGYLRDDDDTISAAVLDEVIGSLEKARALVERYEDELRAAAGRDYDETFRRLVGQS